MRSNYWLLLTSLLLAGCGHSQEKNKFTNYYNQGEQLYIKHCSNCHQPNGTGLGRVYPPLHQSDFMKDNFEAVICLMKNGIDGPLLVNGKEYNQAMPGIPTLTDLEIAEIATYIYNAWQHKHGMVDVAEVSRVLRDCTPTLN